MGARLRTSLVCSSVLCGITAMWHGIISHLHGRGAWAARVSPQHHIGHRCPRLLMRCTKRTLLAPDDGAATTTQPSTHRMRQPQSPPTPPPTTTTPHTHTHTYTLDTCCHHQYLWRTADTRHTHDPHPCRLRHLRASRFVCIECIPAPMVLVQYGEATVVALAPENVDACCIWAASARRELFAFVQSAPLNGWGTWCRTTSGGRCRGKAGR